MKRLRMAVVGVGHLGKEHARILASIPDVELVGVVDLNTQQAKTVAEKTGSVPYQDYRELLDSVDAASIVVPTTYHATVARDFLAHGVSLLVEKPFTRTVAEAEELLDLAKRNDLILQVGHIERFNPAFEELQHHPLQPRMIRAQRLGPFTGRSTDIGVVLDLMIHDLDLVLALVKAPVVDLSAWGTSIFGKHEDIACVNLRFAQGTVADITASRAHFTVSRSMQVWGPEGFAELDFGGRRVTMVQPTDEVRLHGLDPLKLDPNARARIREDLFTKYLERETVERAAQDQLTAELTHFVECVRTKATPVVSGNDGRDAIALAERILLSIRAGWREQQPNAQGLLFPHSEIKRAA